MSKQGFKKCSVNKSGTSTRTTLLMMDALRLSALLLAIGLNACSAWTPAPISRFELQTPRPFGYVIGDEIRHRIVIETREDMRLNPDSLPKQGSINRWLNLNQVSVEAGADEAETTIVLVYQPFYAPNEVKMLTIPGFNLRFDQLGKTVEQAVPDWHFTLSPLKELAVRKDDDGFDYMRPDALPEPLSTQKHRLAAYASLSLALLTGAYLAYLYGYFPAWPKRRIFKRAGRELAGQSPQNMPRGLAIIHHAFNMLNGQPLFKHRLQAFYQSHPEYETAGEQIAWFFNFSNQVLFAGKQDFTAGDWDKLRDLCRVCREIERGSR